MYDPIYGGMYVHIRHNVCSYMTYIWSNMLSYMTQTGSCRVKKNTGREKKQKTEKFICSEMGYRIKITYAYIMLLLHMIIYVVILYIKSNLTYIMHDHVWRLTPFHPGLPSYKTPLSFKL